MRFEDFVSVYPREYTGTYRPKRVPKDFPVFEGFQSAYSTMLHDFFRGEPADRLAERYRAVHAEWHAWGGARLDQLVRDIVPAAPDEVDFRGAGHLLFGQMLFAMEGSWQHVFLGAPIDGIQVRKMQLFLCGLSVHVQNARAWAATETDDPARAASRKGFHAGLLSEVDAAVLMFELSKRHKWLTVLPAPAAFESAAGRANSDLLLLDLERREALGVQVKSRVHDTAVAKHYLADRVVLIDGSVDLGNTRAVEVPRRSDPQVVSWPGLIAAHYFASRSDQSQDAKHAPNPEWFRRMRGEARRLAAGTSDYRQRALSAVSERILSRFSRTASSLR